LSSAANAQSYPGRGIEFEYSNDSTYISVIDSLTKNVIWVGALPASGNWTFEAGPCLQINVRIGHRYSVTDTIQIRRAWTQIKANGDTVIHPAKDSIRTRSFKHPDTLRWEYTCSNLVPYTVPLGCWETQTLLLPKDTTIRVCDTVCRIMNPVVRDSSWIDIDDAQMANLRAYQLGVFGVECDTSRVGRAATICGTRDVFGRWHFNLKERIQGYQYRKTPLGYLPSGSDTCHIRYGALQVFYGNGTPEHHDMMWLDSVLTVVPCSQYQGTSQWHRVQVDTTICLDIVTQVMSFTDEPVWNPAGRDTIIYVDKDTIECPKFSVQCVAGYLDTVTTIVPYYLLTPIVVWDTIPAPWCVRVWDNIPIYGDVGILQFPSRRQLNLSLTQQAIANHGCDSAAGKEPVLVRKLADSSGIYVWHDVVPPKAFCDFNLSKWSYYTDPSSSTSGYRLPNGTIAEEWCWLPAATIDSIATTSCDPQCLKPMIIDYVDAHWGWCCEKDTTVFYYCNDPVTGMPEYHSFTYRVEDKDCNPDTINLYLYRVIGYDSTLVSTDTLTTITWIAYSEPHYIISAVDSCLCEPTLELANGTRDLCSLKFVNSCDPWNQPYWDTNTNTVFFNYNCLKGVWINGQFGDSFNEIVTETTLSWYLWQIFTLIDSLRIESINCCQANADSVSVLRMKLDSLQTVYDACCADKPVVGKLTLDGDGRATLTVTGATEESIITTTNQDGSGSTTGDAPNAYYDTGDNRVHFTGGANRTISYIIYKTP